MSRLNYISILFPLTLLLLAQNVLADNIINDELFNQQPYLKEKGIVDFWSITQGEGVTIALIDSGVDYNHPDLQANILVEQGYDFGDRDHDPIDANGHGTAMAGIIAAQCNNGIGGCGVAPNAKIIPYKINASTSNQFASIELATAILTAAGSEADIICLSLVFNQPTPWVEYAIDYARLLGKLVVAAAGNEGTASVSFPANLSWPIAVGAVDTQNQRLPTSNYGAMLTLSAPANNLLTPLPGTGYADWFGGTSAATAFVSGVLALLKAAHPNLSAIELQMLLLNFSQDGGLLGIDTEYGAGVVSLNSVQMPSTASLSWEPSLEKFSYQPGEQLDLILRIAITSETQGNLWIKISYPTASMTEPASAFVVWDVFTNTIRLFNTETPFNHNLGTPFVFQNNNIRLPFLHSSDGLLGDGTILADTPKGMYEITARLSLLDTETIHARQIFWIGDTY